MSKSFTAVAVLELVEAGRVGLDTPVRAYLPDFHPADPAASAQITVRHLLNQTSGMVDAGFPAVADQRPADLPHLVRSLHDARLVSEPGREFHYFNPNYQCSPGWSRSSAGWRSRTTCASTCSPP